jgi:hypothetical protein
MSQQRKGPVLEQGLLSAMRALDNQIARQMERSPADREASGVQKWEPYQLKIEQVCALMIKAFGEDDVRLDSVLIVAQAMTKSLYLISEELGEAGLGAVRSGYCRTALNAILRDAERGLQQLGAEETQLN